MEKQKTALNQLLTELKENPYPEDVFLPVSSEELKAIHLMLLDRFNMPIDRLTGHIGRVLRKPLIEKATELLEAEKQIIKDAYDKGAIEQFNYLSNNTTGDFKTSDIYFTETFENPK